MYTTDFMGLGLGLLVLVLTSVGSYGAVRE